MLLNMVMFKVTICDFGKMNINMTDNKESKMKRFVIIFISLIVGYALYWCISDYYYKKGRERCIVGKYKLDIHRTNLGIYKKKVEKYKGLILTFNADKTFSLNISVPFMADTVGTWKVGGMNEWNEIVYHNDIIDQFGKFDDGDTIIYINSATPQHSQINKSDVYKIYFVKMNYIH